MRALAPSRSEMMALCDGVCRWWQGRERNASVKRCMGARFQTVLAVGQKARTRLHLHRHAAILGPNACCEIRRNRFLLRIGGLAHHSAPMLVEVEGGVKLRLLCQKLLKPGLAMPSRKVRP